MDALVACVRVVAPLGAALGLGFLLRRTHLFAVADGEVSAPNDLYLQLHDDDAQGVPTAPLHAPFSCRLPPSS